MNPEIRATSIEPTKPPLAASRPVGQPYEKRDVSREILASITDAFVCLDRDFRIVSMNAAAERLLGKRERDFIGRTQWEAFPACAGSDSERHYRRAMSDGLTEHFEYHYVDPGVYDFWLEIHVYPSHDGINILYRDIGDRKRADGELRKFQFLADHAADAFFLIDSEAKFVYVNNAGCWALGYSQKNMLQMTVYDIDPLLTKTAYDSLFKQAEGGRLPPFETKHRRSNSTVFPVEASVSLLNAGGKTVLFACCRDITERKLAEQEMRQSAARQRRFLRDVLASVTEGRLVLCQSESELPRPLTPFSETISISMSSGVRELRHAASDACESNGFSDERLQDLITAVSEAGMNAAVHAGEGVGQVFVDAQNRTVQVRVADRGPGISLENLPHATLQKGFTTAGTLGHGMKMMLQTADRVYLLTGPDGTIVVIEQERVARPPVW